MGVWLVGGKNHGLKAQEVCMVITGKLLDIWEN